MVEYSIWTYDKKTGFFENVMVPSAKEYKSLSDAREEAYTWMCINGSRLAEIRKHNPASNKRAGIVITHRYPLMIWVDYKDMKVYYANARNGMRGSPVSKELRGEIITKLRKITI